MQLMQTGMTPAREPVLPEVSARDRLCSSYQPGQQGLTWPEQAHRTGAFPGGLFACPDHVFHLNAPLIARS